MRSYEIKKQLSLFIILSILFCEMCFSDQPFKTYSFATSQGEISSSVQIHILKEKQLLGRERLTSRSESGEVLRRAGRRVQNAFIRKATAGLSSVEFLPQTFHSTIFLQNHKISHNTSGHIDLIRCVYQKDGKKRENM